MIKLKMLKFVFVITILMNSGFLEFISAQVPVKNKAYVLGVGDKLTITFWQRPTLNSRPVVTANGNIELPLIGTIQAAGLSINELRNNIADRISLIDTDLSQVAVVVDEYGSKFILVTGSVANPGKMTFEVFPNLWQIILEAGGALKTAVLEDVIIVRGLGEEAGRRIRVNVVQAIASGDFSQFPQIYAGDTIIVPDKADIENPDYFGESIIGYKTIRVFGQVAAPGKYAYRADMDLIDALTAAGGPGQAADLKNIRIFFRGEDHEEAAIVNVETYLENAYPKPLGLNVGDAIYVPRQKRGFSAIFGERVIGDALRVIITSTVSFIILRAF